MQVPPTLVACQRSKLRIVLYKVAAKLWRRSDCISFCVFSAHFTYLQAVRIINSCPKWGAQVVYGDTDSLFVYLRGRTKAQAFKIGNDIADSITALNPFPIKLKFEKVRNHISRYSLRIPKPTELGIFTMCLDGKETICRFQIRES